MRRRDFGRRITILGIAVVVCAFFLCGCKGETELKDFGSYTESIEEIALQENVRIVALGEATHGNKEFQELKLDVFEHLVKTSNVRGFALEGDFGGCAVANDYVLYNEGNAEEAVKNLGFQIYRTDQMLELIEWMHEYNQTADESDKVRIYGYDMQRDIPSINRIKAYYQEEDAGKSEFFAKKLDDLYGEKEGAYDKTNLSEMKSCIEEIIKDLEENADVYGASDEESYDYALQAAKCLLQNIELHGAGADYSEIRDKHMTENVKWILEREEKLYGTRLMISGHNGHVAKVVNSAYTNMGYYLSQELQDAYYVIGTDFYKTSCSIATKESRENYEFCSDDPLAKAVGSLEKNMYYLNFEKAKESSELKNLIESNMRTGSLGESYSPLMKVIKNMYQIQIAPDKLYDGMIFVYEATPIEVWDYQN